MLHPPSRSWATALLSIVALVLTLAVGLSACSGPDKKEDESSKKALEKPKKKRRSSSRLRGPDGKRHRIRGKASYYSAKLQGNKTACGEIFDVDGMTAAHRTLPFGTIIRVTNRSNGKRVKVRVNDRGPYGGGRILDLSPRAAGKLGYLDRGVTRVKIKVLKWGKGC